MTRPGILLCASMFLLAVLTACGGSASRVGDAASRVGDIVNRTVDCGAAVQPIHDVQGSTDETPRAGEQVTVRGVVVGDFQASDQLGGFFIQEPRADDDPETSEGLFIFAPQGLEVAVGDLVQVSGRIKEHWGLTELNDVGAITVCERGVEGGVEISPVAVTLSQRNLERYEGMLVVVNDQLTVSDNHLLAQSGQLLLSSGGRSFQRTNGAVPGTVTSSRRLLVDDGSRVEHRVPPPFLDASGTRRAGDTITGLTGIITEDKGSHMLLPTTLPRFESANPREGEPPEVPGNVRVVSFNLLNFFTTLENRGASSALELERQSAKHVATLSALDADVVGLIELENNDRSIHQLVNALNASTGEQRDTWAHISTARGEMGNDDIRVGIIYRPAVAQPVGAPSVDRHPVFRRPPLAQTFEIRGERLTVVVNHFKSKSCRDAVGVEKDRGQGCWNTLRTRQASRIVDVVTRLQTTSGDDDVLVIGDLNAYGAEDPIRVLTDAGLVDQIAAHVPPEERYSYIYKGESGYLDHALTTPSLADRVAGAAFWHINADEPVFLDYNTENGLEQHYAADPYRSSDHDPVLIGLDF